MIHVTSNEKLCVLISNNSLGTSLAYLKCVKDNIAHYCGIYWRNTKMLIVLFEVWATLSALGILTLHAHSVWHLCKMATALKIGYIATDDP